MGPLRKYPTTLSLTLERYAWGYSVSVGSAFG